MDTRVEVAVDQPAEAVADRLRDLSRFAGPPAAFWTAYLEASGRLCGARRSLLLCRKEGVWRIPHHWSPRGLESGFGLVESQRAATAAEGTGFAADPPGSAGLPAGAGRALAVRLPAAAPVEAAHEATVLVVLIDGAAPERVQHLEPVLRLAAAIPAQYELGRHYRRSRGNVDRLIDLIALAIRLGNERRFMKVALTLCNELAGRFACDRVSLGWLDGSYVRLQAISHTEKFDHRMAAAQQLESAMEEAFDQDEEVVFPAPADGATVVRCHDAYARSQGAGHLLSLPLRVAGQPEAVVTAERRTAAFSESEMLELRLIGDAIVQRLADLRRRDRWIGARAVTALREGLGRVWGIDHSLAKLAVVAAAAVLLGTAIGTWEYRIEAPFTLRTEDLVFLPAPFDGYLREVGVEVGDVVAAGRVLVSLDTSELVLEEAAAAADVLRFAREAEKARAVQSLADMQIAQARREQAAVRLARVRHQLTHSRIVAPIDGIVVEGDLKQSLGAPVRKGDLLFKVARIDRTFAELEIDETDVHEVAAGSRGEIAFVGRPDLRFPFRIERVAPIATLKEAHNRFLARAAIEAPVEGWWRPGMTGTAKVDAGRRSILWLATHRTMKFLQKMFWL